MHTLIHALEHSFLDSIKLMPFIFLIYFIIEYFEHKNNTELSHVLQKSKKLGVVCGALLGSVPQCGFSVIAADMYSKKSITLGTLIAIFIATSDEAVPIILSHPEKAYFVIAVIIVKLVIAVIFGIAIDLFYKKKKLNVCEEHEHHEHFHGNCEKCDGGAFKTAVIHTVKIFVFIFIATFVLSYAVECIGEERLASYLLKNSPLQPFVAALIGLIPNCAASVILTETFLSGALSFGSLIAGLSAGAGVGVLLLFKRNKNLLQNISIAAVLYAIGAGCGLIIQLIRF